MRRKIAMLLALMMVVSSLSGCGKKQEEQYENARNLFLSGKYTEARKEFKALEDFSDSKAMMTACDYQLALVQLSNGEYIAAAAAFAALGDYENAKGLSKAAESLAALGQYEDGDAEGAIAALAGTKLAQDLGAFLGGQGDLSAIVGTWACTLNILQDVQSALTELAKNQDKLDEDFIEEIELKDLSVKISLVIDRDGLAWLKLDGDELDRVATSFGNQLHEGVEKYVDGLIDEMAEEKGISREEVFEEYEVKDAEGVFQEETGIDFAGFERSLTPNELFDSFYKAYNGAGVAVANRDTFKLRFPEREWDVDTSTDGKLTITDGTLSLTLTKIP